MSHIKKYRPVLWYVLLIIIYFSCYLNVIFLTILTIPQMLFILIYIVTIMEIKEETNVRYQGKISLITTIPKTYVKALNIESGDTLEWTLNTKTEKLELQIIKWEKNIMYCFKIFYGTLFFEYERTKYKQIYNEIRSQTEEYIIQVDEMNI